MSEWKNYAEIRAVIEKLKTRNGITLYDLETTGTSRKKDSILQFSAVKYRLPDWQPVDELNIYIKPPFPVNGTEASKVNHITDELLADKGLDPASAFALINRFLGDTGLIGGYNNKAFDDKFMDEFYHMFGKTFAFEENIDVYKFVKMVVSPEAVMTEENGKKRPCYKLSVVAKYYNPDIDVLFHSAIGDVNATAYVLRRAAADAEAMMGKDEKKEEARKEIPRRNANVFHVSVFNPSQRLKRVYVNTSQGTVYYDDVQKVWRAKTGSVDSLDMEGIIRQVFKEFGITQESELFAAAARREREIQRQKIG